MTGREVAGRYGAIARGMTARVEACTDWSMPTPCPEWTARDIVDHVVDVHRRALALLGTDLPPDADDPMRAWSAASAAMFAALQDPTQATRVVSPRFGDMPFEQLASRMVCSDALVHTWDLARATHQDEHLDAGAVEFAWTWMQGVGDNLRASGDFGPPVDPPPDADIQTRLLCFLGRAV
jgi:uncharacterized protein (TIGR03086 family)